MSKNGGVEIEVSTFDGEELLPLDTIGGIMQRISKLNADARKRDNRPVQCPSTFTTGKRSLNTTFCTLHEGHEGEHRGYRKRWPNTSKPAPSDTSSDATKETNG